MARQSAADDHHPALLPFPGAEHTAITLLEQAGIPTGALARPLRLMNQQRTSDGLKLPVFPSTHPDTGARIGMLSAASAHGNKAVRALRPNWMAIKTARAG